MAAYSDPILSAARSMTGRGFAHVHVLSQLFPTRAHLFPSYHRLLFQAQQKGEDRLGMMRQSRWRNRQGLRKIDRGLTSRVTPVISDIVPGVHSVLPTFGGSSIPSASSAVLIVTKLG